MSKKLIIIAAGAGLLSFAAAFAIAWLTKPTVETPETAVSQAAVSQEDMFKLTPSTIADASPGTTGNMKKAMTEKQLKNLVYEVREKIHEYDSRLKSLKTREKRIETAQGMLKNDINELNNLRVELASTIITIKNERDKLDKSRIEIARTEKNNLVSIAATYDKMEAEAAGKILANISLTQTDSENDAVKILYYMSERAKAKLLAQMSTTEPELAAFLCRKLKQIIVKE
ncbi:MAG: hypothetical protein FVQ80_05760 [Planctomycetes bacterium]|nr:hypothetical protein [Planctomycetota bacterium]